MHRITMKHRGITTFHLDREIIGAVYPVAKGWLVVGSIDTAFHTLEECQSYFVADFLLKLLKDNQNATE